ncbi:aminopeptidase [Leadbettera azotonutricia]|uniref:Putative aminopeptidase n=1 Tax=Leadbettera azotonutricia (strain ATCC BAA-888 / DSM 13862 / ZAS-9) TaxID=545695 RepID=F5YBW9_LEAAZ|nr:aminopeptidase [Leadbettera azotonutricia]AEF80827.1 putative aminopeptidase [Leadbettera azotonutricia ZAS-9]
MRSPLFSLLPVLAGACLILAGAGLLSGCYTLKQGSAMLGYLGRAVPLEDLLEDTGQEGAGTEDAKKNRLFAEQVVDIRRFAMDELGLKESKNYTRYVELDRDYLAAVVSASAKDSFTTHEWWFPVVGKVPYKGFFNPDDARKEAKKLQKKELDVWIRGVDAFSTLGWFKDPLYSYMKEYPLHDLADLIIHELLHATVYLKSYSRFNEQLAEFVGTEGARLYMEKAAAGADDTNDTNDADIKADRAAYIAFIQGLITELNTVYQSGISREEKLARKAEIITATQALFEENYESMFKTENYRGFSKLQVNNAYLELYSLYYEEDTYFKDLYERSGRDLPAFINAAKLLKGKGDPKEEFEKLLDKER